MNRLTPPSVRSNRGPSLDDVMLGDYIGKADED